MSDQDVFNYFKMKLIDIDCINFEKSNIISYESGRFKINYHLKLSLLTKDANFIANLFTHSNFNELNEGGDVSNPRYFVRYLTFQCRINDNERYREGEIGGRFIVAFHQDKIIQYIREDKLNSLFNI